MSKTEVKSWDYAPFTITFDERADEFVVNEGEELGLARRPTLTAAKLYCDNLEKRRDKPEKKRFDPVVAWYKPQYNGLPTPVTVTSVCEDGSCWVTDNVDGSRKKVGRYSTGSELFIRDAASVEMMSRAGVMAKEEAKYQKAKIDLIHQLVKLDLTKAV